MPTISVIIPAYNAAKTIEETIASVFAQTFTDFEIVVINDGSQDDTFNIVSAIPDSRIRIFSYPNGGVATSRNRAIEHSTGKLIAPLDADDLWQPDKLWDQLQALEEHPEAMVAYSWTDHIDEQGERLRRGGYATASGNVYPEMLLSNFLENGSNPLIYRQAFLEVGNFDQAVAPAEDWDMWIRLAARYPFVCVPKVHVLYRHSTSSGSANITRQERASIAALQKAFQQVPEHLQCLKDKSLANIYIYLVIQGLESFSNRQQGLFALQFFRQCIKYDPRLWKAPVSLIVLLRGLLIYLLPTQAAQRLFARAGRWLSVKKLYWYSHTHSPNAIQGANQGVQ